MTTVCTIQSITLLAPPKLSSQSFSDRAEMAAPTRHDNHRLQRIPRPLESDFAFFGLAWHTGVTLDASSGALPCLTMRHTEPDGRAFPRFQLYPNTSPMQFDDPLGIERPMPSLHKPAWQQCVGRPGKPGELAVVHAPAG